MLIAHKIELVPNKAQREYLAQSAGCARFAYNWALTEWKRQYQESKTLPEGKKYKITEGKLRKQLNAIKTEQYPFLEEVSKYAAQEAIIQLGKAFKRFFKKLSGHPTYRKRYVDDRFTLGNDVISVKHNKIKLPKVGEIKMRETLRFDGKIKTVSISRSANNRWFVALTIEVADHTRYFKQHAENQGEVVGLDAGLTDLAVLSTGKRFVNPKTLQKASKKLKQLQRALMRKVKGSKNRQRAKLRVAKQHAKVANIRKDILHKMTAYLTDTYKVIVVENLNIKGMLKNRRLAKSISDAAWGEMVRQLLYKAKLKNGSVIKADKFYPSSKLCSCCGWKKNNLRLSDRVWTCEKCHTEHDRDLNAARNLKSCYAVSSTVNASGEKALA